MRWRQRTTRKAIKDDENRKRRKDRHRQGEASKRDHFDGQCKVRRMSKRRSARKASDRKATQRGAPRGGVLSRFMHLAWRHLGTARDTRSARNGRGRRRGNSVRGIQHPRCADPYANTCRGEVWNVDTSFHSHFIRMSIFVFVFSTCCIDAVLARTHMQYHECAECMCIGRRNRHRADRYRAACRLTHTHSLQLHSLVCRDIASKCHIFVERMSR